LRIEDALEFEGCL